MATPLLVVAAIPAGRARLRQFFDVPGGPVSRLLERPPQSRDNGFGLRTNDLPHLVDGSCLEVRREGRLVVHLYPDGRLILRAAGDREFLSWPPNAGWSGAPEVFVNPVVATELFLNCVLFYRSLLPLFDNEPSVVRLHVEIRDALPGPPKLALYPGPRREPLFLDAGPRNLARDPNPVEEYHATAAELKAHPEVVAFSLAKLFYSLFELDEVAIPYVRDENGVKSIDVGQFR